MKTLNLATFATLVLCAPAFAHDYAIGEITVEHPMAFETPPTARTAGGFLTITNAGDTADRLMAVVADFPRVELHTTEMEGDIARMQHLHEGIAIPPGATVTLAPGGMHVMFMGLGGDPFEVGEEVPATLIFETAGEITVTFKVEARKEMTADHGAATHDGHDHGDHSGHADHADHSGHSDHSGHGYDD